MEERKQYQRPAERWTGSEEHWGRLYAYVWRYKNEEDRLGERFERDPRRVVQEIALACGIEFDAYDVICKHITENEIPDDQVAEAAVPEDLQVLRAQIFAKAPDENTAKRAFAFTAVLEHEQHATATLTVRLCC